MSNDISHQMVRLLEQLLGRGCFGDVVAAAIALEARQIRHPRIDFLAGTACVKLGRHLDAVPTFLKAVRHDRTAQEVQTACLVTLSRLPDDACVGMYEAWLDAVLPGSDEEAVLDWFAEHFASVSEPYGLFAPLSSVLGKVGMPERAVEMFGRCLGEPGARLPPADVEEKYRGLSHGYDDNAIHQETVARFMSFVDEVLGDATDLAIVDAGCGSGMAGPRLRTRARSLTGVDVSADMLRLAEGRRVYDSLVRSDMCASLAGMEAVDAVVCLSCTYYLQDIGPFLCAAATALAPGGVLLLQDFPAPEGQGLRQTIGGTPRFCRSADMVRREAVAAGLEVGHCQYSLSFTLPSAFWALRRPT